jgi:catechol 2,3-dioxygenase-like lactoylglutathione lyase family enzyme
MQFDHLMHWVPDLDAATRAYQGLGFTIQPGGEHPGVGTRNAAWRIDARYVELITVHDEGVARAGFGPAWPAIDANLRAGGGGLAFAILVSDVTATVAELRARGVSVEDAQAGSLQQPDGSTVTWALAFLSEGPAWAPFLINYGVSGGGVERTLPGAGIPDRSVVAGPRGPGDLRPCSKRKLAGGRPRTPRLAGRPGRCWGATARMHDRLRARSREPDYAGGSGRR